MKKIRFGLTIGWIVVSVITAIADEPILFCISILLLIRSMYKLGKLPI
jgi:hypothetical protein